LRPVMIFPPIDDVAGEISGRWLAEAKLARVR
jgi:hypothetical protein